jgi:hypothetical protein
MRRPPSLERLGNSASGCSLPYIAKTIPICFKLFWQEARVARSGRVCAVASRYMTTNGIAKAAQMQRSTTTPESLETRLNHEREYQSSAAPSASDTAPFTNSVEREAAPMKTPREARTTKKTKTEKHTSRNVIRANLLATVTISIGAPLRFRSTRPSSPVYRERYRPAMPIVLHAGGMQHRSRY